MKQTNFFSYCVNFQQCLWNVLLAEDTGSILFEIEPDTFSFDQGEAKVQIGTGNKDEFDIAPEPDGTEETFNGPVSQSITVNITGNEAWVQLTVIDRNGIAPFSFFYHIPGTSKFFPSRATSEN